MNGLEPNDLPTEKERDEICETLVVDSAAKFGHEATVVEHESKKPVLTRFFYKHSQGLKETAKASTVTTIADSSGDQLGHKSFQQIADMPVKGPLAIKLENPSWADLQTQLTVLKGAKGQLEKAHTEAENIGETLGAMAKKDPSNVVLQKTATDMKALRVLS